MLVVLSWATCPINSRHVAGATSRLNGSEFRYRPRLRSAPAVSGLPFCVTQLTARVCPLIVAKTLKWPASSTDCTGTPSRRASSTSLPDIGVRASTRWCRARASVSTPSGFSRGSLLRGASSSMRAKCCFASGSASTRCSCATKSR